MTSTAVPDLAERPAASLHPRPLAHPPTRPHTAPQRGRPASQSALVRVIAVVAFGAVLTAAVVNWSLRHGRLILMPDYDDIGYMEDGVRMMRTLHDEGLRRVVVDYVRKPVHSPYSALLAMAAFTVFGVHDWAPYVASVVLVCGYFALADRLLRGVPLWQKLLVFLFVMSVPLVGRAAAEFRPDHASALLLAGGLVLLLGGRFLNATRRHQIGVGALCGLGVLAKPPMFIAAGLLIGWALVLATAVDYYGGGRRFSRRQIVRAWKACLVPFVLIPLPHFLVASVEVVSYIYDNMFGRYRHVWATKGTLGWHLNYYLFGSGAQTMLGDQPHPKVPGTPWYMYLLLAILTAGLMHVLVRRRRREMLRAGALFALLLATYVIPAVTRNKSMFFGLSFHTFLLFLGVLTLRHLLLAERLRRSAADDAPGLRRVAARPASVGLVALAALGLFFWTWPTRVGDRSYDWIQNRRDIVNGVFQSVVNNPNHVKPTVFVACVGDVNKSVLTYLACRDLQPVRFYDVDYSGDRNLAVTEFARADMVVAAESGSGLVADFLPNYTIMDSLLAELRSRTDYREVGQFIFKPSGKGFYLFERIWRFGGWSEFSGLGPIEGPSEHTGGRPVRWGFGPVTTLTVDAAADSDYKLFIGGRGWGGQEVAVKVDGREVARVPVPHTDYDNFTRAHVPFRLPAGRHEIRLEYSTWDKTTSRPMAVLFDRLSVRRVK